MSDTASFGLGWENIAIAAGCLVVLLGAIFAAFRGGRRRRDVAAVRVMAEPATAITRPAPSLDAASAPVRADRAEPVFGRAPPGPVPAAEAGADDRTEALARTQAELLNTVKRFKAELDELRHADTTLEQRLAEAEQTIRDLREAQRLMTRAPRRSAATPDGPDPTAAADPPEPPLLNEEDETMARARRAIDLLRGE